MRGWRHDFNRLADGGNGYRVGDGGKTMGEGEMMNIDEVIKELRAITKDFENGSDGMNFDLAGDCKNAADLLEQFREENEMLKLGTQQVIQDYKLCIAERDKLIENQPVQCGECIHFVEIKNFDNECGITGGCVNKAHFCGYGERRANHASNL